MPSEPGQYRAAPKITGDTLEKATVVSNSAVNLLHRSGYRGKIEQLSLVDGERVCNLTAEFIHWANVRSVEGQCVV